MPYPAYPAYPSLIPVTHTLHNCGQGEGVADTALEPCRVDPVLVESRGLVQSDKRVAVTPMPPGLVTTRMTLAEAVEEIIDISSQKAMLPCPLCTPASRTTKSASRG